MCNRYRRSTEPRDVQCIAGLRADLYEGENLLARLNLSDLWYSRVWHTASDHAMNVALKADVLKSGRPRLTL